jgi:hypothetical protein
MINALLNIFPKAYADDVVGTISLPAGIPSEVGGIGNFLTVIIRFFIIVAGLFTLWQFLSGGFAFITSNGDKAKITEATSKITMSLIGLVIIAASFIIIAIASQLLFGSFTAILAPQFSVVQSQ